MLVPPDRVGDIDFADGHLFADSEATIEEVCNRAAASVGHEGFQTDDLLPHPGGFWVGAVPASGHAGLNAPPAGPSDETHKPVKYAAPEPDQMAEQMSGPHEPPFLLVREAPMVSVFPREPWHD